MLHSWSGGDDEDLVRVMQSFGLTLSSYARVGRSLTAARSFRCGEVVVFDLPFTRWNPTRLKLGGRGCGGYEMRSDSAFASHCVPDGTGGNVSNEVTASEKSEPSDQVGEKVGDCPYCAFEKSVLSAAKLRNIPLFMASAACALWPLILTNDNANSVKRAEHRCCADHNEIFWLLLQVADAGNSRDSNNASEAKAIDSTFSEEGSVEAPPPLDEAEPEKDSKGVANPSTNKPLFAEDSSGDKRGLLDSYRRASYHLAAMHVPSLPISPSMKQLISFCDWFVEQWFSDFTCNDDDDDDLLLLTGEAATSNYYRAATTTAASKDSLSLSLVHAIMAAKVNSHRAAGSSVSSNNESSTQMKGTGADKGRTENETVRSNVHENVTRGRMGGAERNDEVPPIQPKQSSSMSSNGLGGSDGRIADGDWCLLPIGSKLAHSCSPNLFYAPPSSLSAPSSRSGVVASGSARSPVDSTWSSLFRFIAIRDIEEGEVLSFSYVGGPLLVEGSAVDRQQRLLNSHMFTCVCERCRGWDYTRAVACPNCTLTDTCSDEEGNRKEEGGAGLLVRRTSPLLETPFDAYPSEAPLWQCRRRRALSSRTATDHPECGSAGDEGRSEGHAMPKREESEINRVVGVLGESVGCGYFSYCDPPSGMLLSFSSPNIHSYSQEHKCRSGDERGVDDDNESLGLGKNKKEGEDSECVRECVDERAKKGDTRGENAVGAVEHEVAAQFALSAATPTERGRTEGEEEGGGSMFSSPSSMHKDTEKSAAPKPLRYQSLIPLLSRAEKTLSLGNWATQRTIRGISDYFRLMIATATSASSSSSSLLLASRAMLPYLAWSIRYLAVVELYSGEATPSTSRRGPFLRRQLVQKSRGVGLGDEEQRIKSDMAIPMRSSFVRCWPRWVLTETEKSEEESPRINGAAADELNVKQQLRQSAYPHMVPTRFILSMIEVLYKDLKPFLMLTAMGKLTSSSVTSRQIPSATAFKIALLPILLKAVLPMAKVAAGTYDDGAHTLRTCADKSAEFPTSSLKPFLSMDKLLTSLAVMGQRGGNPQTPSNEPSPPMRRGRGRRTVFDWVAFGLDFHHHTYRPSSNGSSSTVNNNGSGNRSGGGGRGCVYGDDTFIGAISSLIEAIRGECSSTTPTTTTATNDGDNNNNPHQAIANDTTKSTAEGGIKGSSGVEDDFVFLDALTGCLASDGGIRVQSEKGRTRKAEKGEGHTNTLAHQSFGTSLLCDLWI